MLQIGLDAVVLMVLLKVINDDDTGFGKPILIALLTSIGTMILAVVLGVFLGTVGVLLAAVIAAGLLGVAVSAIFDV